jgi:hypothetical protein
LPFAPSLASTPFHRVILLPPVPKATLDDLNRANAATSGRRLQIGLSRNLEQAVVVNRNTVSADAWSVLPNGWRVLSVHFTSAGALGLRLHLESISLPSGARLLISDPANTSIEAAPITSQTFAGKREFWSDTIFSDHAVVQVQVPPEADPSAVTLTVTGLSHLYAMPIAPGNLKEGTCHNDVTCFQDWANEASGVARMSFVESGNTYLCTGCLLASSDSSQSSDFFLTANHCIPNQNSASTIELFWFYQTSSCNGAPPDLSSVPHTGGGAEFLAGSSISDFTFLRLRQASPSGALHLQWTLNPPGNGDTLTGIHHPTGAYKRISFGTFFGSDDDFWAVAWNSGVTEPGSSGSPLFNTSHQVVGQLNGGFHGPGSSCDNPTSPDQYGRFDVTYNSIKQWLGSSDVPPPVAFVKGTYNGLFRNSDGISQQSSGTATLTTTATGKFTGRLQAGSARYSFNGQFDNNGTAQLTIPRRNLTPLTLQLQVDPQDSDHLIGSVASDDWSADLSADRAVFDGRTTIAPQAGQYTLLIPGDPDSSIDPGGNGYGIVSVDKAGRIRLSGSLADGTAMSQSATLSKNGQWPLYISLYGGQGSVFSWVNFDGGDSFNADLSWIKPAMPNAKLYSAGFSTDRNVVGSRYNRPATGNNVLNFTDGNLVLNGGDLSESISDPISLTSNRVTDLNGNKLTLTFSLTSGTFTGRIVPPGSSKSLLFRGVVLQNQNVAAGFFLGTDQSGQVLLGP